MSRDSDNEDAKDTTIFVNNKPFTTTERELTGYQVKALAGVPSEYELFQVKGDQTVPVGNDEVVKVHNNEHFRAIPAGTFGYHGTTSKA